MKTYFNPNELIEMAQRDAEKCVKDIKKEIFEQEFFMEYVSAFTKAFYDYAQISKEYSEIVINQEREEINDAMYCHWQSVSEDMFEEACERIDLLQSNTDES